VLAGVVTGVIAVLVLQRFLVRRSGGPEAARVADIAVRRRRLPADVEPAVLRRALRVRRTLDAWSRGLVPAVLLLGAAAFLWIAFRGGVSVLWLGGGLLALAALTTWASLSRRMGVVDALLGDLDPRSRPPA
jgi:hypothetical protein